MQHVAIESANFVWSGKGGFELNVSQLHLARGEKTLLLGASGSGKSTLLSLIACINIANQGTVQIAGNTIAELSSAKRDRFRAEEMGIIFQQFNLLPFATVHDNIALPLRFAPKRRARVSDIDAEINRLMDILGLPQNLTQQRASTLSVGQQQRVAVARALIGEPPLIIADEPTSALDSNAQSAFIELLNAQADVANTTVLMVSHDERLGVHFDRVIRIEDILEVVK